MFFAREKWVKSYQKLATPSHFGGYGGKSPHELPKNLLPKSKFLILSCARCCIGAATVDILGWVLCSAVEMREIFRGLGTWRRSFSIATVPGPLSIWRISVAAELSAV